MKRKKTLSALLITGVFVMLVSSGCYTKFYRPGMEIEGPYSASELYNRYDSSAIDTTLTKGDYFPDYYPDNGWYNWGSYRYYPHTRWGFDFYNFSPGYYHTYYGYYDYYGTPWWNRYDYNRDHWWYRGGGGYNTSPGEPPETREGRRQRESYSGGGATYTQPSGGSVSGAPVSTTPPAQVKPAPPSNESKSSTSNSGSSQKRTGKRRR
ncbi:hypothetical protein KKG66_00400 [bacterium]|nr:hypothetical protein [bacterium]